MKVNSLNFKRGIMLCLACCLLLSVLTACRKENAPGQVTSGSEQVTQKPGNDKYSSNLPENIDFDNEEFVLLSRNVAGADDEFYTENQQGAVISETIFGRNAAVEEWLNISLSVELVSDNSTDTHATIANRVYREKLSGTSSCKLVSAPLYTVQGYVTEDVFVNLNEMTDLNLGKYYWAQGFNKYASVGDSQYLATGAISLANYRYMYVTAYNNRVFDALGMESVYDLVKDGSWTMEKQNQMVTDTYSDLNGNGEADEGDAYGFLSGSRTNVDAYWISTNTFVIGKDEDNYYEYIGSKERISGMIDKILTLYGNEGSYIVPYEKDNTDNKLISDIFLKGNVAMATVKIQTIELRFPTSEFQFSIAPLPKYNENQKYYYTNVQDQVTVMAIPSALDAATQQRAATVLEALAAESYESVYPVYFENILPYRYLQNPESVEMLNIIYEGCNYSIVFQVSATNVAWTNMIRDIVSSGYNSTTVFMNSETKNIPEYLDGYNALFKK